MLPEWNRKDRRPYCGFLLVEVLIALAFLAIATGLTLKMHQSRLDFDRVSMDRLSDQLVMENIAERLSMNPYPLLRDAATRLANESGFQINVDPFESGSKNGLHITIVIESESGPLTHHLWRFEVKP